MSAYYNEFDEKTAAWLRELIRRGLIAPGDVDTRSIVDVRPDDLAGYTQCHFFAGIGVWSYAARLAGWPDDRPLWTGSPPCQPFSAAGKGLGTADERHLWPAFFHLIDVCRPDTFIGEQVASKDALAWLDHVSADVEGAGYAFGAFDLCAAGFGAPHIRQRLKFVGRRAEGVTLGDSFGTRLERHRGHVDVRDQSRRLGSHAARPASSTGDLGGLSLPDDAFWRANLSRGDHDDGSNAGWPQGAGDPGTGVASGGVADASDSHGRRGERGAEAGTGQDSLGRWGSAGGGDLGGVADDPSSGWGEERPHGRGLAFGDRAEGLTAGPVYGSGGGGLADANGRDTSAERQQRLVEEDGRLLHDRRPGPTNGLWADVDWLLCRDGRWRPVEPGTFPLAHGAPARVGRLRGYGNAIVAPAAAHFIASFLDAEADGFTADPVGPGGVIEMTAIERDLAELLG